MLLSARLKRHNPTFILNDGASPLRLSKDPLEGGGNTQRHAAIGLTPFDQKHGFSASNFLTARLGGTSSS